jgi:hypothetical protein
MADEVHEYRHRNGCWSVINPARPCDCRDLGRHVKAMAGRLLPEVERLIEAKRASGQE